MKQAHDLLSNNRACFNKSHQRLGDLRQICQTSRHAHLHTHKRGAFCSCSMPPLQERNTSVAASRRQLVATLAAAVAILPIREGRAEETSTNTRDAVDTTITDVVYMDVGVCPDGVRADRSLGDKAICTTTQPLGRIIIGLYGRLLPQTVSNFLALVKSRAYSGTTFSRVIPGGYVQAGRQGSPRMGLVQPPTDLPPNNELLASRSFRLEHSRPGTVSLSISENDDEPILKQRPSYRPTEFLITTGPGPVPSLDGQNVVFGTVLEGYNTVTAIASQPTFKPNEKIQAVNQLASFIGDERAARVRAKYGKPLKSVVITDVGVLPIREPFPRPV